MSQLGEQLPAIQLLETAPTSAPRGEVKTLKTDRPHLYELDVIRTLTALAVVGVHVAAFSLVLAHTRAEQLAQYAAVSVLHFTREIFLAITAFVMVYGYAHRPISAQSFWRKRGVAVLLPYVAWSVFYDWQTKPSLPPVLWTLRLLYDLLAGNASFQLYYILLTLEFYLILPWFLNWIQRVGRRPWRLLGASFLLQLLLLVLDYHYLQSPAFAATELGKIWTGVQDRFLPLYQFYIILGGLAALYLPQVRAFLRRYGIWTVPALVITTGLLVGNLVYQAQVTGEGMLYGASVFQPTMVFFSLAVAAFLFWIAGRWALGRAPRRPSGWRFWQTLSLTTFGIYLIHAYLLDLALADVVPRLPAGWPEPLEIVWLWGLVAGGTLALCLVFLRVPLLCRLIGHAGVARRDPVAVGDSPRAGWTRATAWGKAGPELQRQLSWLLPDRGQRPAMGERDQATTIP